MHLANYLGLVHRSERNLADAFRQVANAHEDEPDVYHTCLILAQQCDNHSARLLPICNRYGEDAPPEPDRLHADLFQGTRTGGLGLLRDLHDLYLMANEVDISWVMIKMAAQGIRDRQLLNAVELCEGETAIQLTWLKTRMKQAAPQTLIVAA